MNESGFGTVIFVDDGRTVELRRGGLLGTLEARHKVPVFGAATDLATLTTRHGFAQWHAWVAGQRVIYFLDEEHPAARAYGWNLDAPEKSEWGTV